MMRWTLLERIGSGSTGEVWRAQAPSGQLAALKQAADSGAENQRRSLKVEAAILAGLSHPHIPALLDADLEAERPYLVMTLAEGEALNVLIASGALWGHPLSARLSALESLAEAVDYLHGRGLIHRDIKPSNMRGLTHPLLLDFGLACAVGQFVSDLARPTGRCRQFRVWGVASPDDSAAVVHPRRLARRRFGWA